MNNSTGQPIAPHIEDLGYPADVDNHLTHEQARQIMLTEGRSKIQLFLDALKLQQAVSIDDGATLLANLVKETLPTHTDAMATRMRECNWDQMLGEQRLQEAAINAQAFLQTHEGIELSNYFTRVVAKASDSMWDDNQI
jgi:hypothetical protein